MEILFALVGIVFLVTALAGFIFAVVYLARKLGFLKPSTDLDTVTDKSLVTYYSDFKILKKTLAFRFGMIVLLVALLNIPLNMVDDVVMERSHLHQNVLADIASTWGHKQTLQGPVLLVPYTEKYTTIKILTDKDGHERKVNKTSFKHHTAIVLPEVLNIEASLLSQTRKRSLYQSLVYTSDINILGSFNRPDISSLSNNIEKIHWDRAWFTLGISDTQAINQVSKLSWNSSEQNRDQIDFEPGTQIIKTIANGFHAPLDLTVDDNNYQFSLTINVNGSEGFYFSPFGKITNVSVNSDWPHPSFQGSVLPSEHLINEHGFNASWSVPHLARNYPQLWTLGSENFNLGSFKAGVNLFETVSLYSKITRAIKYGSLFFILTYITFLIFEMGIAQKLHIIQYGIIGLALSMFYLTLLSLAEKTGFELAYLSAASIIIVMICLYAYSAIKSLGRTTLIASLLSGLYFMLYTLLKLEDHALMGGTVLLLVILAIMMYMTRDIGKVELSKTESNA